MSIDAVGDGRVRIIDYPRDFITSGSGFTVLRLQDGIVLGMPHWSVVLILATLSTVLWLPWRYSLRTMLIATTLVAVVLAALVFLPISRRHLVSIRPYFGAP